MCGGNDVPDLARVQRLWLNAEHRQRLGYR